MPGPLLFSSCPGWPPVAPSSGTKQWQLWEPPVLSAEHSRGSERAPVAVSFLAAAGGTPMWTDPGGARQSGVARAPSLWLEQWAVLAPRREGGHGR